jgi:hypothetical protein
MILEAQFSDARAPIHSSSAHRLITAPHVHVIQVVSPSRSESSLTAEAHARSERPTG